MSDNATLHCRVKGRVQGVFFRVSTRDRAMQLGLCGWVRNLPDRRVEAVFHGPRSACEQALAWIAEGPPSAHVEEVEHSWEQDAGDFAGGFEVR